MTYTTAAARPDVEAALRPIVQRFERYYLGRSPRTTDIFARGEMIVVRSQGVMTDAESRLILADPTPAGREMVEQLYRKMVRQSQDALTGAVEAALGVSVRTVLCDIDAVTGESVLVFVCEDGVEGNAV